MKTTARLAGLLAAAMVLTACASSDPLGGGEEAPQGGGSVVKIGSADFSEAEIIAELYAQALEAKGLTVERTMRIGSRDVYVTAVKDGSVDLVPEYTGNLLQYLNADAGASSAEEINAALTEAMPDDLKIGEPAAAENKDSYNVRPDFSEEHGITSLADLADYQGTITLAAGAELEDRPYGPKGLTKFYNVPEGKVVITPMSDAGGPLTVKALVDGDAEMANIYTTTPAIKELGLVTLEDPENMIIAQNVVPLMSTRITDPVVEEALNAVSAELTTDDLLAMNGRNQGDEKASANEIAADWLAEKGLN